LDLCGRLVQAEMSEDGRIEKSEGRRL